MPRPRKEHARDTRELALNAATALLHERGYLGVSMDEVAGRIGVRKASLYHHFPGGKEQMILEIAERAIDEGAIAFARAAEVQASTRERLTAIAAAVFADPRHPARVLRDALRFMTREHQDRIFGTFYRGHYLRVRAVMEEGVTSGELRPHDTERSAWAFLDLISEMGSGGEVPRNAELAGWIVALIIDGLGT